MHKSHLMLQDSKKINDLAGLWTATCPIRGSTCRNRRFTCANREAFQYPIDIVRFSETASQISLCFSLSYYLKTRGRAENRAPDPSPSMASPGRLRPPALRDHPWSPVRSAHKRSRLAPTPMLPRGFEASYGHSVSRSNAMRASMRTRDPLPAAHLPASSRRQGASGARLQKGVARGGEMSADCCSANQRAHQFRGLPRTPDLEMHGYRQTRNPSRRRNGTGGRGPCRSRSYKGHSESSLVLPRSAFLVLVPHALASPSRARA